MFPVRNTRQKPRGGLANLSNDIDIHPSRTDSHSENPQKASPEPRSP